jgi:hypothetical protein
MEDLERDRPIVPQVVGQEDGRHAAAPKLTLEAVSAGQTFLEQCPEIGHELGMGPEEEVRTCNNIPRPGKRVDRAAACYLLGVTGPPPRPTPFDLVFAPLADERFPAIRDALARAGHDPRDRDAFLLMPEAIVLLRELRPEGGLGEGVDQLAALLHHAYLFWDAGELVRALSSAELAELLERERTAAHGQDAPGADGATPDPPAAYVQMPERRVWARPVEEAAFEPLDGLFVHLAPGDRELRTLGVFGLHPDRLGFTVVEAVGPRAPGLARADGSPLFAPSLPGAAAAGLNSIIGAEELLELAWRARDLPEGD